MEHCDLHMCLDFRVAGWELHNLFPLPWLVRQEGVVVVLPSGLWSLHDVVLCCPIVAIVDPSDQLTTGSSFPHVLSWGRLRMEWHPTPAHRLQEPLNSVGVGVYLLVALVAAVASCTLCCGCVLGVYWRSHLDRHCGRDAGLPEQPGPAEDQPREAEGAGAEPRLRPEVRAAGPEVTTLWAKLTRRALRYLSRRRRLSIAFAHLSTTATLREAQGSRPSAARRRHLGQA